jgi:hypothetical protein
MPTACQQVLSADKWSFLNAVAVLFSSRLMSWSVAIIGGGQTELLACQRPRSHLWQ